MADPEKGNSSVDLEKYSQLDKEIGKEFLTSWKSMSLTEDYTMDFSFDAAPKGKKKTFNFEKLDMDFNLDGDFEKLSSFQMDMQDLDFSSSSKKTAKPKQRSKDESSENFKLKKDQFSFSFDFNELDSFDLNSSLMKKGGESSNKSLEFKELASDRKKEGRSGSFDLDTSLMKKREKSSSENLDFNEVSSDRNEYQSPKISEDAVIDYSRNSKPAVQESTENSKAEILLQGPGACNSKTETNHLEPQTGVPSKKILSPTTEDMDKQSPSIEDTSSSRLGASETAKALHGHFANGNDFTQNTDSDIHREDGTFGTKVNLSSSTEQTVDNKMRSNVGFNRECLELEVSSILYAGVEEKSKCELKESGTNAPTQVMDQTRTPQSNPDTEDTSTVVLPGKRQPDTCAKETVQMEKSTSKLPLVPSSRKSKVYNLKAVDEVEVGPIRSRFSKRPDETGSHVLQPSRARLEVLPPDRERVTSTLCPANEKNANDTQLGRKSIGDSRALHVVSPKAEHILLDSDKNVINLSNKSSQSNASSPTQKTSKLLASRTESLEKSKTSSLQRLKLGKNSPDPPITKSLRTIGANKASPYSTLQREVFSLKIFEQNMELPEKKSSEIHHSAVKSETQRPQMPSLKRKTFEDPNAGFISLKPLKRLSGSPSESRKLKDSLESVVEDKVCGQENRAENKSKNITYGSPKAGSEAIQEVNMTEMEMPLVMEKDDNVEKAEAYTKELENICNMLRKKHEEAKEQLVRAIVNNNNLLMLNHPIYEEKIRMVQKFAAKLMS